MRKYLVSLAIILVSSSAIAQDNEDYKEQLCAKVQQCELGKIAAAEMPVFMQDIVVQTINSQCITIASSYEAQIEDAGLEDDAKSCVHSLENQSCDELLATQGVANTDECNDFLTLAEEKGIDFSKIEF